MASGNFYSKNEDIQETCEELEQRGFFLSKSGTHFKLFSDQGRFVCVIPGTPGDNRAGLNTRAEIRRWLKQNQYPQLEADQIREDQKARALRKSVSDKPFNAPTLKEVKVQDLEKPKVEPKIFGSPEDIEYAKKLLLGGKSYVEAAEILASQGFIMPGNMKPIAYGGLNQTMLRNGFRQRTTAKAKKADLTPKTEPMVAVPANLPIVRKNPYLQDVVELVSSNLPDDMKEKFLIALAREKISSPTKENL